MKALMLTTHVAIDSLSVTSNGSSLHPKASRPGMFSTFLAVAYTLHPCAANSLAKW